MNNSTINNISFNTNNNVSVTHETDAELSELYSESILQILDEPFDLQIDRSTLRTDEEFFGFDNNAGDTWIYPKNYPIRAYQYNITKVALFRNTLVSLPTGLGKTFIAAVVMYNIYRWYPLGKIIFMAPTRPLVAQQIEACFKIMGIPKRDTVELTGKQTKTVRCDLWQNKRVFFATPQTVQSDISSNPNFPFKQIRLIVVDEAHKAKGKYAYTEVINSISNRNRWFRVLALSATPGRHIEDVVEVIRNLQIAHVEIRWENSIDVAPYTFKKNIKTELVPLNQKLKDIKNDFVLIIDKYVRKLMQYDVLTGSMGSLSRNSLLIQHKRFRENTMHHHHPNQTDINTYFSTTISLFHALDLLERHGIRSFLTFFEDDTNSTGEKYFVSKDYELKTLMTNLKNQYRNILVDEEQVALPNGLSLAGTNISDYGHPKFQILKQCLLNFFVNNVDSRAIVFCEYRETVLLVYRMLLTCEPTVRAKFIVGKGSSIGIKAVTEKQQKNVMAKFREGVFNTLIATCVAEEGIDVGEVGLIICFDTSTRNPTRFVQRMGRTGRQRQGSVVMLVTEGSEFDNLKDILSNKDKTNQKIVRSGEILKNLYKGSSRLVPPEFDPKCLEVFIKIVENPVSVLDSSIASTSATAVQKPKTPVKKKPKSTKAKPVEGMRDMRAYFGPAQLSDDEQNVFSLPQRPVESTSAAAVATNEPAIQSKMKTRNRLLKHLVDDQKALNRSTDLNVCKLKSNFNFQSTLNDKNLDDRIKILFLKSNLSYLGSKVESLNVVEALNVTENQADDEDDDCILIEPEFQKLKTEIEILQSLFDFPKYFKSAKNYADFLKVQPKYDKNFNLSFINLSFCNRIVGDLGKLRYELFSKQVGKLLNETEIDNSIMDITHEWEADFHKSIKKKVASSPAASTSRRIPIQTKELNSVDEFLTLNYFKLKNFDEIFESDSEDNAARPPRRLLFDTEVQIFGDDDDELVFNEILSPAPAPPESQKIDDEVEITTDQILAMFDTAKENEETSQMKQFDLGNVDDLFCSDDDDLFADCDDDIAIQQPEDEENDQNTQEYDFANFDKSSDLFEATTVAPSTSSNNIISLEEPRTDPNKTCFSQSDVLTQINPDEEMSNENLLDMETQINPECSNIFQLQTQPFRNALDKLTNEPTQINPNCINRGPHSPPPNNIFEKQSSKLDMETQINPECSNIFQLQTQPFRNDLDKLTNEPTQINPNCINRRPHSPPPNNIFEKQSSKLDMETQINPECSNIFQLQTQPFRKPLNTLTNQPTQINPYCNNHRPYSPPPNNIFAIQTQKFTERSPSALFKGRSRLNASNRVQNASIIEFSQIPVSNVRNRKRIIDSSDDTDKSLSDAESPPLIQTVQPRKRRRRCEFIDDEAVCDDELDNPTEEFTQAQSQFINSLIDDRFTEHEHNTSVDMQQVYLKSIKSPGQHGKFILRQPPITEYSNIFSQLPEQDEDYHDESFVVGDDEAAIHEQNQNVQSNEDCLLERAERILKEKRRKKRRKKRKIVILPTDSSDSSGSGDSVIIIS